MLLTRKILFLIFLNFLIFDTYGQSKLIGEIRINLAGYPKDMPKTALILSNSESEMKVDLKSEDGKLIKRIAGSKMEKSWEPFSFYHQIDFSEVKEEGSYYLQVSGTEIISPVFQIGPFPAWQEDVVSFIRTQRCGFNPLTEEYCHQNDGLSFFGIWPDSTKVDARGGWHDAGDQLKYLITGSNTTARLLMTFQMNPESFVDESNEMGMPVKNELPDILDEAKWGLDWILKLHPGPNELYHQVADDRDHRGFKLPHEDNADYGWGANSFRPVYFATGKPQGLSQYKSLATGISNLAGRSAATLALGYQVFISFPAYHDFAERCLKAANELYLMGKKQEGYQQGNSYSAPYRYEENTWADDMEWAAAELFKISKEKEFLEDARRYASLIKEWSWMERDSASHYEMYPFVNMGHYALWQVGKEEDKKKMVEYFEHNLEQIQNRALQNPYEVGHLFIWCSNNLAAAVSTQAMLYEEMTGSQKYRPLLINHVNWLLGLNPWGTSMITGLPENADFPVDVHMPFWRLLNVSVKGSLVDGPIWTSIHQNMLGIELSEPDEYAHLQPPHVKYMDDWMDYSTNEPTLDGSAELLMILTYLNHEK
ncbi:glycoside hydrolase family 9 protein [Algoriphagus aestuarii]|nr:glycoside hydrolase family 9 protein [Algoriphagus aestuarii]